MASVGQNGFVCNPAGLPIPNGISAASRQGPRDKRKPPIVIIREGIQDRICEIVRGDFDAAIAQLVKRSPRTAKRPPSKTALSLVAYALLTRIDEHGHLWPGGDDICRKTGLQRAAVERALFVLAGDGVVSGLLFSRRFLKRDEHYERDGERVPFNRNSYFYSLNDGLRLATSNPSANLDLLRAPLSVAKRDCGCGKCQSCTLRRLGVTVSAGGAA